MAQRTRDTDARLQAGGLAVEEGQVAQETVGHLLARSREQTGQDLRTVCDVLRIRYVYLHAIEEERYQELPGATYAVGFVRTYAEYLGLDPEETVRRFKEEVSGLDRRTSLVFPVPKPEGRIPGGALILISLLLIALVYGGWYLLSSNGERLVDLLPSLSEDSAETVGTTLDGELGESPEDSLETAEPLSEGPALEQPEEAAATETQPERPVPADDAPSDAAVVSPADTTVDEGAPADQAAADETPTDEAAAVEDATPMDQPAPADTTPAFVTPAETDSAETAPAETAPAETGPAGSAPAGTAPAGSAPAGTAPAQTDPAQTDLAETNLAETNLAETDPAEADPAETDPADAAPADAAPGDPATAASPPAASGALVVTADPTTAEVAPAADEPAAPPADVQVSTIPAAPSTGVAPVPGEGRTPRVYGAVNADSHIVLRAVSDSWVQVRDGEDTLLFTQVLRSGDSYRVPDRQGLMLLTGNAGGLEILVDDQMAPTIGPVGAVRRDVPLDPERLLAGTATRGGIN